MFFFDLFFSNKKWYRKLRGGTWYKFLYEGMTCSRWEWVRSNYLICKESEFDYHTKEIY